MNQLRFQVTGQKLRRAPNFVFPEMVAGTKNFYVAVFDLDESWIGYACVGCFDTIGGPFYAPIKNGQCVIPEDALRYERFHVSVMGKKAEQRITTDTQTVMQTGGIIDARSGRTL